MAMAFLLEQDRGEWTTLTDSRLGRRGRRIAAYVGSALIHAGVLAVLCWPAVPLVLAPRAVAHGEGGNATFVSTALYLPSDLQAATQARPSAISLPAPRPEKQRESRLQRHTNALEVKEPSGSLEAGSPSGTSDVGLAYGDEVKPALPTTFPDLKLSRSELPEGVQGDVVVEVTIDAQGAVVEERLLQGLGHGLDERVIAVVHDWRFRPATRNGIPISSKHDVHFHFPS